jgi:hypothetical protein
MLNLRASDNGVALYMGGNSMHAILRWVVIGLTLVASSLRADACKDVGYLIQSTPTAHGLITSDECIYSSMGAITFG